MESEDDDPLTLISPLQKYKELIRNSDNHSEIVKDKTIINFLAYVLDSADEEEVLRTSLDILELLFDSSSGKEAVLKSVGVVQSLRSLEHKPDVNVQIKERAEKLLKKVGTESSVKNSNKVNLSKKKKVLTMHIQGLHSETQKELEDILIKKIKGVYSVIVDVEHQKCTATVNEQVDPKNVALLIYENTEMEAQLITKNKNNQELLVPLLDNDKDINLDELPPYLDEQDSPVKEKAVRSAKDFRITASEWFCTAAGFLQKTLYC